MYCVVVFSLYSLCVFSTFIPTLMTFTFVTIGIYPRSRGCVFCDDDVTVTTEEPGKNIYESSNHRKMNTALMLSYTRQIALAMVGVLLTVWLLSRRGVNDPFSISMVQYFKLLLFWCVWYRWLSVRLQYMYVQCVSNGYNGYTAVLHWAIGMIFNRVGPYVDLSPQLCVIR